MVSEVESFFQKLTRTKFNIFRLPGSIPVIQTNTPSDGKQTTQRSHLNTYRDNLNSMAALLKICPQL